MDTHTQRSLIQIQLEAQGWTKSETNPFNEKVSLSADVYFLFENTLKTQLGICVFATDQLIKLRLADTQSGEICWFQIHYADKLQELLSALIQTQENAAVSSYFRFYGSLSAVALISILTWEQWESNYR